MQLDLISSRFNLVGAVSSSDQTNDVAIVDDFIIERIAADVSADATFTSNFLMSPSHAPDLDPPAEGNLTVVVALVEVLYRGLVRKKIFPTRAVLTHILNATRLQFTFYNLPTT